jgi:PBSX family phage portal protein
MSSDGYWRRKNKQMKSEIQKEQPRISIYKTFGTEGVQKASGQIADPFNEAKKELWGKIVLPPYSLSKLLDFLEDNTWHQACVNIKASLVCGSWEIVGINPDQKQDQEYDALNEFIAMPNSSGEMFAEILNKFWIDFEAMGNAYFEIVRNRGGIMAEMYHSPAHTIRKAKDEPGYYQLRGTGVQAEMLYFKKWADKTDKKDGTELMQLMNYFAGSSYYGLPDFITALGAMILDRNMVLFNNNFFDNSGMIGSILFVKGAQLDPTARTELKNMIKKNFTGVDNAHRFALIDGLSKDADFKIEKIMESVRDISFHMGRLDNRDEIIASHHVPPKLLHIAQPGQLGAVQDGWNQMKMFKQFEIGPSQAVLAHRLNKLFEYELGIKNWKIKFKEMEVSDDSTARKVEQDDVNSGIRTINEIRESRGLEPLEVNPQAVNNQNKNLDKLINDLTKIEKSIITNF